MTNDWFELDGQGIVQLRTEAKAIPQLQPFLKDKAKASKYWQYVWHMENYKSPYSSYSDLERQQKVMDDFLKEKPSQELIKLCNLYQDQLQTPSMKLLKAAKKAALHIAKYLENEAAEIEIDNIKEITDTLGKIGKIIESLDKLEEKVKKEITNDEKVRGGGEIRTRER